MSDFGFYNMDCMEGMKEFPDKYFDLAVVDPPYCSGPERRGFYGRKIRLFRLLHNTAGKAFSRGIENSTIRNLV